MSFRIVLLFMLLACVLFGCAERKAKHYLGYIEGKFVHISPNVSGNLVKRLVGKGDVVKPGQALFVLDQQPEADQLKQAQHQLVQQQQRLKDILQGQRKTILMGIIAQQKEASASQLLAKQTLDRNQRLFNKGAIARQRLDESISAYGVRTQILKRIETRLAEAKLGSRVHQIQAQRAVVKAAMARVAQLQWRLHQKTGYSNLNGRVFDTFFRPGEFVPAGQPVLSLLSPKYVRVVFYVPEPSLSSLKLGSKVAFGCDGCKDLQAATISFVSQKAEFTPPVIFSEESRSKLVFEVEAKIPAADVMKYHPGQPVQVYPVVSQVS